MIVKFTPVDDPDTGLPILWDIYVDGEWIGSRRTLEQACRFITDKNDDFPWRNCSRERKARMVEREGFEPS